MNYYEIKGEIVSKKNKWRKNRYGSIYQSAQKEIDDIVCQLKEQKKTETIYNDVFVTAAIFGSNKRDAVNEFETIADCLQSAEVIHNDRQIKQFSVSKAVTDNKLEYGAKIEIT